MIQSLFSLIFRDVDRKVQRTITTFEMEAYKRLTAKSGTPSSPGEYPARQTGELANSIESKRTGSGRENIEIEFSLTAEHAKYLTDRKLLDDVMEEIRPQLDEIWK